MRKKLVKTGNSLALVLDRAVLEATGIDAETPLEVSTDGEVIVVSPVRDARRTAKLKRVMERAHGKYAGAFKRLAE
jgi:antitoxin component of MazEF toxin-antitoxin module